MAFSTDEVRWLYTALKKVEFLSSCSMGELEQLVKDLMKKHFPSGTVIVREGDEGDYLFLLHTGGVSVQVKKGALSKKEIARLGPGDYFGEMALISREPRSATVVATEDTDAFLLFESDFRRLLLDNKDLARQLEAIMVKRRAEKKFEMGTQQAGLFGKIKRWAGL